MAYCVDKDILYFFWDALNDKNYLSRSSNQKHLIDKITENGWATTDDLEELLASMDSRLSDYRFDLKEFSKIIECNWEAVYLFPKSKSRDTVGFEALSCYRVAQLLIVLERLGFHIDPTLLIDNLLPFVKSSNKAYITSSELDVLWFKEMRHKGAAFKLFTKEWNDEVWEIKKLKTCHHYKVEAQFNKENELVHLMVSAPKHRKRRKEIILECQDCGFQWEKGNLESGQAHRKEHLKRMAYLDPQPFAKFLVEKTMNPDPELVTSHSPKWKHKLMYERALAFKREFHYDVIQWDHPDGPKDPNFQGFLLASQEGAIIGACAFMKIDNGTNCTWGLEWVWICLRERRKGHFSQQWASFKKRFGDFIVKPPLSSAMQAFLNSRN